MSAAKIVKDALEQGIFLFAKDGQLQYRVQKGKSFSPQLKQSLKANKAQIIEYLMTHASDGGTQHVVIERANRDEALPLSFAQQRLWFIEQLQGQSGHYNVPMALRVVGEFSLESAAWALQQIVERHEILRTVYHEASTGAVQVIKQQVEFNLTQIDLREFSLPQQQSEVLRLAKADAITGFDLNHDIMLRATWLQLSDEQSKQQGVLLLNTHHIASDAWSMGILIDEFGAYYQAHLKGQEVQLPPLDIQYADFSRWQREQLQGEVLDKQLQYWTKQLADAPIVHSIPLDFMRPEQPAYRGKEVFGELSSSVTNQVNQLAKRLGVTPFMLLHGALSLLLSRHSNQTDVVIGIPVANRMQQQIEPLIGFFVNTLVLRTDSDGYDTFSDFLQHVRQVNLDAQAHQDIPFEQLVEHCKVPRSTQHAPLFQILFNLNTNVQSDLTLEGAEFTPLVGNEAVAKFDLTINARSSEGGLSFTWVYDTALFTQARIEALSEQFYRLVAAVCQQPDGQLAKLPMLSASEQQFLLKQNNDTQTSWPLAQLGHHLFEQQVEQHPQALAVLSGEDSLTFQQLNTKANRLAHYLIEEDIVIGARVGIAIERSIAQLIAVLAVMKAGATYVALAADAGQERLSFMISDADIELMLLTSDMMAKVPLSGVDVFDMDDAIEDDWLEEQPEHDPDVEIALHDCPYILYTSGSTGQPKGVMVNHQGLSNYLHHGCEHYLKQHISGSVVSSPLYFDATITSLLVPLCGGKPVELLADNDQTLNWLYQRLLHSDTALLFKLTPAHLEAMLHLQTEHLPSNVAHCVVVGGEALPMSLLQRWQQALLPNGLFINEYGPTETVVGCCIYQSHSAQTIDHGLSDVPIGKPIGNTQLYVLDDDLQLKPKGSVGELYIGGAGVALGYLNQAPLTERQFIDDPFGKQDGQKLYKTGDLVRFLADGNLTFLGRIDDQVKIRGFRVELGEIQYQLLQSGYLSHALVLLVDDVDSQLVAYVVADKANVPVEWDDSGLIAALREHLTQALPQYMVPTAFVLLPEFPLTANGKIDKKALPSADGQIIEGHIELPQGQTETVLRQIWAKLLRLDVDKLSVTASFFELGGHSLLAIRLVTDIREQFQQELAISDVFKLLTVRAMAQHLDAGAPRAVSMSITPVQRQAELPLLTSFAQQRLLFIDKLAGGSDEYNLPLALEVEGEFDVDAAEQAIIRIIERHESLRTVFSEQDGQMMQKVCSTFDFAITRYDLSDLDEAMRWPKVLQMAHNDRCKIFDLSQDLMLRASFIGLDHQSKRHVLLFNMHHIASDGWSMGILLNEFVQHYQAVVEGRADIMAPLAVQYADYALWQRDWLSGEVLAAQLAFWQQQLAELPSVHQIPLDYPRPQMKSHQGALVECHLEPLLSQRLQQLATEHQLTLFMLLHGAFALVLSRHGNSHDVVIGTPVANRMQAQLESLIGFFVNTLVLRVDTKQASLADFLAHVRTVNLDAQAHQDVPFEQLVEHCNVARSTQYTPLFQIMFSMDTFERDELAIPQVNFHLVEQVEQQAKFDLELSARLDGNGIDLTWIYDTAIFSQSHIETLAQHLNRLLQGMVEVVDATEVVPQKLPMLSGSEIEHLLTGVKQTDYAAPETQLVHQWFTAQALRTPDNIALGYQDKDKQNHTLTYRQLDDLSNQMARYLVSQGVKVESLVGVCLYSQVELIVGILAILKAGGAYLPIDPKYPAARIGYMVNDSGLTHLLTLFEFCDKFSAFEQVNCIAVDDSDTRTLIDGYSFDALEIEQSPATLAYVIYTSGSTGEPKGVMAEHRNWCAFAAGAKVLYQPSASDRVMQFSSVSFDIFVEEFSVALLSGARLQLVDNRNELTAERFWQFVHQHQLTVTSLPTAYWHYLTGEPDWQQQLAQSDIRLVMAGGEALSQHFIDQWQQVEPPRQFLNVYGPTETIVVVTSADLSCHQFDGLPPPIGMAMSNTRILLLDEHMQLVPYGSVGELYIGGDVVARGYLHRPELTAERFVIDPFSNNPNARLYKSGDLACYRPDGHLQFIGRVDDQVKIRGFRIEPSEITAHLSHNPLLANAYVSVVQDHQQASRLVAYVVPVDHYDGDESDLVTQLNQQLKATLPEYMLPSGIIVLEQLPLTVNGKVDRKALPALEVSQLAGGYVAPENDLERQLAQIWANLLGIDAKLIGRHANFFDLGGHSILSLRLVNQIRQTFDTDVALSQVFTCDNLAQLAQAIGQQQQGTLLPQLVQRDLNRPVPLSYAQQRLWFIDRLEGGSPQYNMQNVFRLQGQLDSAAFYRALESLIYRHDILRTRYYQDGQGSVQIIMDSFTLPLQDIDLSLTASDQQSSEVERLANNDRLTAFDLTEQLPIRVMLIRLSNHSQAVVFNLHHIASDGWSLQILSREFTALYNAFSANLPDPLPLLAIQYADYACWQRDWLAGDLAPLSDYWLTRLSGVPDVHSLPLDNTRFAAQNIQGGNHLQLLGPDFKAKLEAFAKNHNVTLFMLLQTVFSLMVAKLSHHDDVVVGTQIAGRNDEKLEGLIGLFVNTIAIRHQFDASMSFAEYLAKSRCNILADFEHQDMPFDSLIEKINPSRDVSYAPLVQLMFSLIEQDDHEDDLQGIAAQGIELDLELAQYDLVVNVTRTEQQVSLSWIYDSALFTSDTIAYFAACLQHLLGNVLTTPDLPLFSLAMLDSKAQAQMSELGQGKAVASGDIATVHGLFEYWAAKQPQAIALSYRDMTISYECLNQKANRLARLLLESDIECGVRVGIFMPRSLQMTLAILAAMKSGAVYVPLDAKLPQERLAGIVEDADIDTVLTLTEMMEHQFLAGLDVITIDEAFDDNDWLEEYCHDNISHEDVKLDANASIYVLYTSGSTGKPKGIDVHHGGVVNYLNYASSQYMVGGVTTSVVSSALSFDATLTTLLTPLSCGQSVHLLVDTQSQDLTDLATLLFQHSQSYLFKITPAHLEALLHSAVKAVNAQAAHMIVIGGEQLHNDLLARYRSLLPNSTFVNEYGPTETVVGCCRYFVRPQDSIDKTRVCPIGQAIDNTQLLVLDQGRQLQSRYSIGELYIGGAGVTKGYVNRAQLTDEKFIAHPLESQAEQSFYRSGDLVRWLPDGNLAFVGRVDSQVKLRGFRIELGEIENTLRRSPWIVDAVAQIQSNDNNEPELVAYCSIDKDQAPASYNIAQLLASGQIESQALYALPNGIEVVGLNKAETEYLYEEIIVEDIYAKYNMVLNDGAVVFDVGANIGMYSIGLASRYQHIEVYSFEPIPTTFAALQKNAQIYGNGKIKAHQFGLSDSIKNAEFTFYPNVSLFSGIAKGREDNIDIIKTFLHNKQGQTIDKYDVSDSALQQLVEQRLEEQTLSLPLSTISEQIRHYQIERIDLLKIDVERSEMDVLRGIEAQDWDKISQIVIEIHDVDDNIVQAENLLTEQGFTLIKEQLSELEGTELVNLYATRVTAQHVETPEFDQRWLGRQAIRRMLDSDLKKALPDYMLPSKMLLLHGFEVTPNGKIDRAKLANLKDFSYKTFRGPSNEVESTLCGYWQSLLGIDKVSIDDSFFELGGHSLLVVRLISMIREGFDLELTIKDVFDALSVANIASLIHQQLNLRLMEQKQAQLGDGTNDDGIDDDDIHEVEF